MEDPSGRADHKARWLAASAPTDDRSRDGPRSRYIASDKPLPQPNSSTSPRRARTRSSNLIMPGAHRSAWKPKPR